MNIKKNKWLIILGVIFVGLAVFAIYKGQTRPKGTAVTVEEASMRNVRETVSGSGKVYPETEVKISSDVSGEVVELLVQEGDSVITGQILARIDPDIYVSAVERGEATVNSSKSQLAISRAQIESNKAQREQIQAQLENARMIHQRNESLKKDGVISQAELDQSLATLKQLEANLRAADANIRSATQNAAAAEFSIKGAQASLKELKTNLSRTTIKAPTTGIVSSLSIEKGERVVGTIQMTGTEMMRISNLNIMEVQVDISENDILKVRLNNEADIEVDAYPGKKFKGVVTHVSNSASNITSAAGMVNNDQVTNFVVKVRVDPSSYPDLDLTNQKYPLRPGMSATVDIYTKEDKGVTVPIQSVTVREKDADKKKGKSKELNQEKTRSVEFDEVVFLMQNDTAAMVKVVTGIQDDEYIIVTSGLKEGDKVITGPYQEVSKDLESGKKVREKTDKDNKKKK
jgi:HlyD family secretion protein